MMLRSINNKEINNNISSIKNNRKKKYILSIFSLCLAATLVAQEAEQTPSPWSCTGVVGLNASATGLVNWAAGGYNNVNGVAFGKVRLIYN